MRIGDLAKRTGVPISTIRYYIRTGLLVPNSEGAQYYFDERDHCVLMKIAQFKRWGLPLETIHRLLSLERVSSSVEQDIQQECIELLRAHQKALEEACERQRQHIEEIDALIDDIGRGLARPVEAAHMTGVPLQALSLLCCPHCGAALQISSTNMDARYIYEGALSCVCGYTAQIHEGILYTDCEDDYPNDAPDIDRDLYRSAPSELVSLIQKSYNWMESRIRELSLADGSVVLETHMNSFFYCYKQLDPRYPKDINIVHDKFPAVVAMYKRYLDRLGLHPNILYLTGSDRAPLPLRPGCVDLLIDYNSTNEYGIYSHKFYLDKMHPYLKPSAHVAGTYYYFEPQSASLRELRETYPQNHPQNYTLSYFKNGIKAHYSVLRQAEIGSTTDSGDGSTFYFHRTGDKLSLKSFLLKRKE